MLKDRVNCSSWNVALTLNMLNSLLNEDPIRQQVWHGTIHSANIIT